MKQKFKIINNKNQKIVGIYERGKSNRLAIICNGYKATKDHLVIKNLSEGLYKKGFSTVRFDFLGEGIHIKQMVEDTNAVVDYFHKYKTIILVGGSLGAIPAAIASIINKKITALVTINGFFATAKLNLEHILLFYFYRLMMIFIPKYRKDFQFLQQNFLPNKIKIPVLVIYTKADKIVSPTQSLDFYSKLTLTKNKKLALLSLKKHNLTGEKDVNKVVSEIKEWVTGWTNF